MADKKLEYQFCYVAKAWYRLSEIWYECPTNKSTFWVSQELKDYQNFPDKNRWLNLEEIMQNEDLIYSQAFTEASLCTHQWISSEVGWVEAIRVEISELKYDPISPKETYQNIRATDSAALCPVAD